MGFPFMWISYKKIGCSKVESQNTQRELSQNQLGVWLGFWWVVGFGDEAGVAGEDRAMDLRTLPKWKVTSETARPRSLMFPLIILPQGK